MDLTFDISCTRFSDLQKMKNKNTDARWTVLWPLFLSYLFSFHELKGHTQEFSCLGYCLSVFSISVNSSNPCYMVPLSQIHWSFSWFLFLTPWTICQQLLLVLPSNISRNQSFLTTPIFPTLAQTPFSLSWIITVALLTGLLTPFNPRVCAPSGTHCAISFCRIFCTKWKTELRLLVLP